MLQGQLHRLDPMIENALNTRASTWSEEHGDIDGALHHARAADDIDPMAASIWCNAARYFSRGRTTTVTRWLAPFTPDESPPTHHLPSPRPGRR